MDVNQLITEHLDIWTSATENKSSAGRGKGGAVNLYGITKLRELIFELAIRGKLVEQDEKEGKAVELLAKCERAKSSGVKEKTFKKQNLEPKLNSSDALFELPHNWSWARLGDVGFIYNGNSVSAEAKSGKYSNVSGLPFIATKNVGYGFEPIDYNVDAWIPEGEPKFKIAGPKTPLICSEGGSAGKKCGLTDQSVYFGNKLFACQFYDDFHASFLLAIYQSPSFFAEFSRNMTGIIGGISLAKFLRLPIPVPPIAEQIRIVAKVKELIELCDALERQTEDSLKAHQTLVEACLAALTNSQSPEDLTHNWTRIEAHFDTLLTTEESIDSLTKTILELGAMGRLVSPPKAKVTTCEILERIAKSKKKLVALGEIRREKPLDRHDPEQVPFALPKGWLWAKIGDLALFTQYGTSQKAAKLSEGVPVLAMGNIQAGEVSLESDKLLPRSWEEFPSLLLQPDDLLYNRTNSAELVGKTGIFEGPEDSYTFASYLIRIRLDHSLVRPKYLNFIMNSPYFRATQIVPKIKIQTGQANVNGTFLKNMLVPLPPTEEQDLIIGQIEQLNKVCGILRKKLGEVDVLKRVMANTLTSKIH